MEIFDMDDIDDYVDSPYPYSNWTEYYGLSDAAQERDAEAIAVRDMVEASDPEPWVAPIEVPGCPF